MLFRIVFELDTPERQVFVEQETFNEVLASVAAADKIEADKIGNNLDNAPLDCKSHHAKETILIVLF